jgi:hypothetical protein
MRRFEPLGIECVDCHRTTYQATTKPNHQVAGYSTNCSECHSANSAGWDAANISHDFFPLSMGHSISCKECHLSGDYTKVSKDCNSCHLKDYNSTKNPNHQTIGLSTNCLDCHTTNPGWKPAKFTEHDARFFPVYSGEHSGTWTNCAECHKQTDNYSVFTCTDCHEHAKTKMDNEHDGENGYQYNSLACFTCHPQGRKEGSFNHAATNFPLTGAHTKSDCLSCHTKGFAGISTTCISCHKDKFDKAIAPVHTTAGISDQCEPCHTTTDWKPSTFRHVTTGYELVGGHTRVAQCADCHKGATNTAKPDCISCHQVQYDKAKDHTLGSFSVDCKVCHTNENWQEITYNHALSKFPLTGAHIGKDCILCHKDGYAATPVDCNACHSPAFVASLNPNHQAAGITRDCEACHITTAWKPSSFNHTTTGFELTGGHIRVVQCSDCHKGTLLNAKTDCLSCHQVQYDNAKDHKSQLYPVDCKMCHNSNDWLNSTFNHATTTFPLTGSHINVLCATCHTKGFTGTPTDCNSCHNKSYAASVTPNHTAAGIPVTCEPCHNTSAWKPSSFNHITTGFELTGGHTRVVQCSDCHKGTLLNTKTDCISCHQVQYDNAKDHKSQLYPVDCKMCHNSNDWLNSTFNHATTTFPLTGSHTAVLCSKCHTNGFSGTPSDCNSCHSDKYNASVTPSHMAAGITKVCEPCHTTTAWKPSSFNHTTTGFALTGGHLRVVQCSDCHKGTLVTAKQECLSCHQVQYDNAKDHKTQAYPTDCKMCHSSDDWLNSTFNHATTTFPLTGSHTAVLCSKCHANGFSGGTPTDCNSCHSSNYNASVIPSHVAAGITKVCEPCHNTTAWKPSSFNHTTTGFALSGGHAVIVQCSDCHKGTVLNTRTDCIACHQVQYDNAKDHKTQAYPTDCNMCHNSTNWLNASFNHASTSFPLTGAHTTVLCAKCHASGYTNTPTNCYACHTAKYNSATNPNHLTAQFPKECEECHTTTAWTPSTFNHDTKYFRIYSGEHKGEWTLCTECHTTSTNYAVYSCITCHEHNKTEMDKEHQGKTDYIYSSTACFACHPRV